LQNFGDSSQEGGDETPNKRWKLGPTKHDFKKDFNMAFQVGPLEAWEREGEWQPTTSAQTKGVDIRAIMQEMGENYDNPLATNLSGIDLNT
jgi:hypothetical protein